MTTQVHGGIFADHAVAYARAGIAVFPLRPRGKEPATKHGFLDATTDHERIQRFWRSNPYHNIGIVPRVGMVVLDEDVQHGGRESLSRLQHEHGFLPETWTARTGNGGRHIWLRAGSPFRGKLCKGVDLKCHTGYLVAPPSIHPNGNAYEWLNSAPIAWAPLWLRPMLSPPPPRPTSPGAAVSGDALVRFVAAATAGNRNNALFWAACRASADGSIGQIRDGLHAAAVGIGLDEQEASRTIESAVRAGGAR